jgi:hypothetical protein
LQLAWVGAPKEQAVAIEHDAHQLLDKYRQNGEWFAVAPDAAVGAIHAAAFRRGQPVLDLDAQQAEKIRQVGYQLQQNENKPTSAFTRAGIAILQLVAGMILAALLIGFVFIRFARIF